MALGEPIQAIPHDARPAIKPVHASTPHTTTTATTKSAPKTPSWLTTAGIEATKQANDSIAPEVQGLQGQQQTYDANQKAYEAAMTGFYSALAPYMAGIQGHVSDAYNSAAQTMGDIGHGYAGELGKASDANTAETNAALARAGQAPITAPGSALTDAFANAHGGSQGTSFAAEGAAKATDAANQPGIWAAQGRDSMTEAIQKAVAGDADFQKQIANVYAKVPALRQQILSTMQDLKLKQDKLTFDEKAKIESLNQGRARIAQGDARLNLTAQMDAFDQKYKIAGLKLRGQALQLQANKFAQSTYNADRNYGIALSRLGIAQKRAQIAALAQEYKLKNGGFSQKDVLKFTGTATALADDAFNGIQKLDKNGDPVTKDGKPVYAHPPLTYKQAIRESRKSGIPLSIALQELNKVYKPGQNGRPFTEQTSPNLFGPTRGQAGQSNSIVNAASQFIGVPYKWGGSSTSGMDCSAFVQQAFLKAGIKFPWRTTYTQVKHGSPVTLDQLQPGDAVFTEPGKNGPNHVGLYIGDGMVQESPHTGDVNKVIPLKDFLSGGFVAARRYVNG